jgi:hypothetical protein
MDLNTALATYAQYADPAALKDMIANVASMDKVTVDRLTESNSALAAEAQNLLGVPQAQRAAALQQMAPYLAQHGVTPQMLQQAMQEGLSDQFLQGVVGQSIGTKGILDQANKERELATQQQTADQGRYESTDVQMADGSTKRVTFDKQTGQYIDGPPPDGSGAAPGGVDKSAAAASVASALSRSGLPAPVVAGFMGNFHVEGGWDGAQGDGGSASGIGQWHADRAANFQRVIGVPVTQATPAQQAQFVTWELQHPEAAGMTVAQRDAILASKTPQQAAARIDQFYERSSGKDRQARISAATAFAQNGAGPSGTYSVSGGGGTGILSEQGLDMAAAIYKKTGQMPASLGRNGVAQRAIINRAAQLTGGDTEQMLNNWQDWKSGQQTLTSFDKGPQGNQVRALNVAIQHLDLYKQAARALQNGNVPMFNSVAQAIGRATGSAPPTNAQALHDLVMDEVTKGVLGTAGGVTDRGKAAAILGQAQSPAQLAGGFDQVMGLLNGQLNGLKQQYTSGTKRDDFEQKLSPTTRAAFAAYNASHGGRQAPAGASATATGPNGAKMALVGGKWVAY